MPESKKKKTQTKFKSGVKKYKEYKKKNPKGGKTIQSFIKAAFK